MRKKVLIVEDSLLLHKMYVQLLNAYKNSEIDAHFAVNGQDGLTKLHQHPDTDLIILDVNMPTMSGLEFLRQVKSEKAFEEIAVILQSTEDKQEDIDRGLAAGATAYLTKPFTPARLHALLDEVFMESGRV